MIDPVALHDLLSVRASEGRLFWRHRPASMFRRGRENGWNNRHAGAETFLTKHPCGYLQGRIFNRPYLAHRVIWAMVHGEWPAETIDHINGDPSDNRISNLREASIGQQQFNKGAQRSSGTGLKGVYVSSRSRWGAAIQRRGAVYRLGVFDTPEAAHAAYCAAAERLHGEFARTS